MDRKWQNICEFLRRYTLATCCILGPILLAYVAFNLAVKSLVPNTTPALAFTYEAAQPKTQTAAPVAQPNGSADQSNTPAPQADPKIYPLALSIAGRYAYAVASGFIYLVSAGAILFGISIANRRMTVTEFICATIPLVILATLIATSKLMTTPYDLARPLLVDKLLDAADSFDALKPLGTKGTGEAVKWLVSVNTFVGLIAVAMIQISLFALSVRPDKGLLTKADLKIRLNAIRWALLFGSAILVATVLASKTLLHWPLKLVSDAQAAALAPIADILTLELGATGTFALFAACVPAIAAWSLDVACFRAPEKEHRKPATPDGYPAGDTAQSGNAADGDDGLAFAPLSMLTSAFVVLAPILASPLIDGIRSMLAVISAR
jgi:hypothetical protein